uniref:Uncharacterized protein n=1 Tax=Arundo donax TaxID=35708 RepID=A0A0A8ZA99_ARUDO
MCGATARTIRTWPRKFTSMARRTASPRSSASGPVHPIPALFTSTSMRPWSDSTRDTAASTLSSEVTSRGSVSASPARSARSGTRSGMSVATTRQPRAEKAWQYS